jgi:ubiquitin-conjugating enzyme E2 D/E
MIPERQLQRRLQKELEALNRDPPPNCSAQPEEGNLLKWTASIEGPEGSPYAGGRFELTIEYPANYPLKPPIVRCVTKIYHPNIDSNTGFIGLNILKNEWCPALTINTTLLSIQAFLSDPDSDDALIPEIAREFKTNHDQYVENAREWTRKYARETPT